MEKARLLTTPDVTTYGEADIALLGECQRRWDRCGTDQIALKASDREKTAYIDRLKEAQGLIRRDVDSDNDEEDDSDMEGETDTDTCAVSAGTYKDREMILSAMDEYHNHTCIKFVQYSGAEPDYIRFVSGNTGCWSSVGRTGGGQDLNLQSPGCLTKKGTAMHEMMHALGFYHEHTRWERDNHVTIHYENIQQGRENNFQKSSKQTTDALGVNYDYRSVMHYSGFAFSANNNPTIESKSLHLKWNASLQKLTVSVKSQVDFAGAVRLDGFPSFLKSIAPRQYSITPTHQLGSDVMRSSRLNQSLACTYLVKLAVSLHHAPTEFAPSEPGVFPMSHCCMSVGTPMLDLGLPQSPCTSSWRDSSNDAKGIYLPCHK
uniref:Metalloendopeptidase n=1 Tax=Timema genevievae TaxID=629358 RepID=A0A7R9K5G5_TIMGE|nr:unnamed protein product [Timema genevievae]